MGRIESNLVEFCFPLVDDGLDTDGFVSVPDHVVHMNLPVSGDGSEGGAGVGGPGHVSYRSPQVEGVERLPVKPQISQVESEPVTCSPCPRFLCSIQQPRI